MPAPQQQRTPISAQGAIDKSPSASRVRYLKDLPPGVRKFEPAKGTTYRFSFLPWKAGRGNATVRAGDWAVNRYFKIHKSIGPDQEDHLCPLPLGRACFVCEQFQVLRTRGPGRNAPEAERKTYWDNVLGVLRAKDRELMLVHVHGTVQEGELVPTVKPKNIVLWDESVFLFGDAFRKMVKQRREWLTYADFYQGCTVDVTVSEKAIGQGKCLDMTEGIVIEKRAESLDDYFVKACEKLCPDAWLLETDDKTLRRLLGQTGGAPSHGAPAADGNGTTEEVIDEEEVTVDEEVPPATGGTEEEEGGEQGGEEAPEEEIVEEEVITEEETADEEPPPPKTKSKKSTARK